MRINNRELGIGNGEYCKGKAFAQALSQFRIQVEAEGSDIEERDFFADVRERTPAQEKARW
ncbi:MAG: hypothetical protein F6J86_06875 [Symploca sp. SIO1B1]|nr:hypothetical protein [Symploca sp. SIO1B1]